MCPLGTGYDIFEGCNSVEERFLPQQAAAESYAGTVGEPTTDKKMPGAGWGVSCSGTSNFLFFVKRKLPKKTTQTYGLRIPWRGAGFAAPAASRFSPDGEAASGGHISFCEERNVGKKVA